MPSSKGSVLITGCSDGGIGSALAAAFAKHGFHVFATARTTQSMSHLKDNGNITLLTLDVVDAKQIKDAAETVKSQTGGTLDYLVSNAGRNRFMPLLDEDIEEAKRLYDINCWGPLQLVQAFSPLLIQAKGTVVFIASVSGYMNVPWQGEPTAILPQHLIDTKNRRLCGIQKVCGDSWRQPPPRTCTIRCQGRIGRDHCCGISKSHPLSGVEDARQLTLQVC